MTLWQSIKKRKWQLLFLLSLGWNIYWLMGSIPLEVGIGPYSESPDKRYTAGMMSYHNANPLASDHDEVHGEVYIWRTGEVVESRFVALDILPAGVPGFAGYRDLKDPIS